MHQEKNMSSVHCSVYRSDSWYYTYVSVEPLVSYDVASEAHIMIALHVSAVEHRLAAYKRCQPWWHDRSGGGRHT